MLNLTFDQILSTKSWTCSVCGIRPDDVDDWTDDIVRSRIGGDSANGYELFHRACLVPTEEATVTMSNEMMDVITDALYQSRLTANENGQQALLMWASTVHKLAERFAATIPSFDRIRFLNACRGEANLM
jgi:hypothetical protein